MVDFEVALFRIRYRNARRLSKVYEPKSSLGQVYWVSGFFGVSALRVSTTFMRRLGLQNEPDTSKYTMSALATS